jgi:hypothetical protein
MSKLFLQANTIDKLSYKWQNSGYKLFFKTCPLHLKIRICKLKQFYKMID